MGKRPVALALYTVRDAMQQDPIATLEKVAALGFDGVEFAEQLTRPAADIRQKLDELGLKGISYHMMFDWLKDDLEGALDTAAALGLEYIAIPFLSDEWRPGGERYGELAKEIKRIAEAVDARGMQLLYHNHDFEFDLKVDGHYFLQEILDNMAPGKIQAELDVYWANFAGVNAADFLSTTLKGRCPVLHAKDMDERKHEQAQKNDTLGGMEKAFAGLSEVGEGTMDFPAILDAAVESAGAQWIIVEQDFCPGDPFDSAAKSRENLKRMGY